jgi:O-antigen/teichoic acid export membrane protein
MWIGKDKRFQLLSQMRTYWASVGEELFELTAALMVMVLVERRYGQPGLGIYAYLTACLYAARYVANCGIAQYVAREVAACGSDDGRKSQILQQGHQGVLWTGLAIGLAVMVSAYFDTGHTRIEERVGGYLIIALTVPVANLNLLKLSALHGLGHHNLVARLRMMRYGLMLAVLFFLSAFGLAPSFLLLAVMSSDLLLFRIVRRHLPGPPLKAVFSGLPRLLDTLKSAQTYMFCEDGLSLLLNIDLFVLGLFVNAEKLGAYAMAAVLVRFFLMVPTAIKPIFKQYYTSLAARGQMARLAVSARWHTVILFSMHTMLALWALLYFPVVLSLFFTIRDEILLSYQIFAMVVPGLIFYSAMSAQEPLLEAIGQAERLKRLTIWMSAINLFLTFYLVPLAGPKGAAVATMLTMLIHFGLFGRSLPPRLRIRKYDYAIAGLAVYLVYALLKGWRMVHLGFWLVPILLGVLFYLIGLYGVAPRKDPASSKTY